MRPAQAETAPPPEAVLIKRARQARMLSPEQAAPRAKVIKSRRWRQIEAGWANGRPVTAEDDVIAHMAAAVGVVPAQLEQAGRHEAAEVLREILRQRPPAPDGPQDALTPEERQMVEAFIQALRSGRDGTERRTG